LKGSGSQVFTFVIDFPPGKPSSFYVDGNGNGDLGDDPTPDWKTGTDKQGNLTSWGSARFLIDTAEGPFGASVKFSLFTPMGKDGKAGPTSLYAYRDYAFVGTVSLGGKSYKAALSDEGLRGDLSMDPACFLIDLDGNGALDSSKERFPVSAPFPLDGRNYELSAVGRLDGTLTISESVPPPEAALGLGKQALAFEATDMDGKKIAFPGDFKGRIVLLDFWATWCGPCMGEVPGLVAAWKKYKNRGFEVLGVTLDSGGDEAKVRSVTATNGMDWRQVYDGRSWNARVAKLYNIVSIPAPYLVDGDTGEILAMGNNLRGSALAATIEKALKKKGK
jgi:thiol-disulfide isomerase/thioredoxin